MTETRTIQVFRSPSEMQWWSKVRRSEGRTIGCVPTMGALHEGHLSLVRKSSSECDETIVTIFVNPLQFGLGEDLEKYPRDEEADLELSVDAGATSAYCPGADDMYYPDRSVYVVEDEMSKVLCGVSRSTHFRGVLTVVAKLFNACLPDRAYFGQKDYQQLQLIKRMVRDLDFPVEIVSCPIIRESDGLAMSSRNRYLDERERKDATCLKQALDTAAKAFSGGERSVQKVEEIAKKVIERIACARIDYVECRDSETLGEITAIEKPAVLALAVFIGDTRLIDNTILKQQEGAL